MSVDQIKQLYGKPTTFLKRTMMEKECYVAGYLNQYPRNIYNPGTEKLESRVGLFYFDMATYKCVAISFGQKILVTPYGKSVGMGK